MYVSPEDARSDLLLAGAVFVFGPIVLRLLLTIFPIGRLPGVAMVLSVLVPGLLTAAVPIALMRYRREPWSAFGFFSSRRGLGYGALLGVPLVIVSVVPVVLAGAAPTAAFPLTRGGGLAGAVNVATQLVTWLGLAVLTAFVSTKARDAFRMDFATIPESIVRIGRFIALVAAIAGALRLLGTGAFSSLALPLGVGVTVYLVWRSVKGPSSTGTAVLLAPTVLLALGSFLISFSAALLIEGVWTGALVAGVGLGMAALKEARGSAWPLIGLALVIALATTMPVPLRLGV